MANYADLTAPQKTLFARGTAVSVTSLQVPFRFISASGSIRGVGVFEGEIPSKQIDAREIKTALTKPFFSLEANAFVNIYGNVDEALPYKRLEADGHTTIIGRLDRKIPARQIFGNAFISAIGNLDKNKPFQTIEANGEFFEIHGEVAVTIPYRIIGASGSIPVKGTAILTRPMSLLEGEQFIGVVTPEGNLLVMNLKNRAVTEYDSYPILDMVYLKGTMYAITEEGLYRLDEGSPSNTVSRLISLPEFDLKKGEVLTRPRYIYLSFSGTKAKLNFNNYEYEIPQGGLEEDSRVRLGKGFKERTGKISISSNNDFVLRSLDMDAYVVHSKRR